MSAHRARKRFGQNFLTDANTIARILAAISPQPQEHLVEVGPGLGALTEPLLRQGVGLDIIEIDRDLVARWRERTAHYPNLTIHEADALQYDFTSLPQGGQRLRVIGNLPYNISTPLLFHLLEQIEVIEDMHFMLQKEVVERMVAMPGSKTYGRLSVMIQYACQAQLLFTVPPGAFRPPPKVDSAIVRLLPRRPPEPLALNVKGLSRLVTQAFSQRRKTLRNALKATVDTQIWEHVDIDAGQRPEQLSVQQYVQLSNALESLA